MRLPGLLEALLNYANYELPQMMAPGLPCYNARAAYEHMRERLLPYLTEARLNLKLLANHVTKWQVREAGLAGALPVGQSYCLGLGISAGFGNFCTGVDVSKLSAVWHVLGKKCG